MSISKKFIHCKAPNYNVGNKEQNDEIVYVYNFMESRLKQNIIKFYCDSSND